MFFSTRGTRWVLMDRRAAAAVGRRVCGAHSSLSPWKWDNIAFSRLFFLILPMRFPWHLPISSFLHLLWWYWGRKAYVHCLWICPKAPSLVPVQQIPTEFLLLPKLLVLLGPHSDSRPLVSFTHTLCENSHFPLRLLALVTPRLLQGSKQGSFLTSLVAALVWVEHSHCSLNTRPLMVGL